MSEEQKIQCKLYLDIAEGMVSDAQLVMDDDEYDRWENEFYKVIKAISDLSDVLFGSEE